MSKPQSVKIDPWTDFPKLPYNFITDDFIHNKLYTAKINAKGEKSSINVKASVGADKKVSDEVKLWFDLPGGRSLYSSIRTNYFLVQLDNGVSEHWGEKWNLYAGFSASKSLEDASLRLGVAHLGASCNSDNRLKVDLRPEERSATWYNRTVVTHGDFTFGFLAAYGLFNHVLVKDNIVLGYKLNDTSSIFLRLLNNGFRRAGFNWGDFSAYFDNVKLDWISRHNDWKYGVEATFNTTGKLFSDAQLVVERQFNDTQVKANVSTDFSAALFVRIPSVVFKGLGKASLGLQGLNLNTEKRNAKIGVQVELNV